MKNCKNCGNAILDPVWGEYKCYIKNRVCVATEKTFGCSDWSEKRAVKIERVEVPVAGGGAGATFTPHVSEDGTLSWTNDKNLKNPAPVNIRGPQGEPGADGTITDEQIKDVLDEYLEENPIEVPEPEMPEMPDIPDKLPNPHKLTLTGAVNAEYDGSKEVEVEIPAGGGGIPIPETAEVGQTIVVKAVDENGKPTEWECAELPAGWEVINEIVTTEETSNVTISTDFDGNPFDLAEGIAIVTNEKIPFGDWYLYASPSTEVYTSVSGKNYFILEYAKMWGYVKGYAYNSNANTTTVRTGVVTTPKFNRFRFLNWSNMIIPIGTKIRLIGRRERV